jgi:hypothetical protein
MGLFPKKILRLAEKVCKTGANRVLFTNLHYNGIIIPLSHIGKSTNHKLRLKGGTMSTPTKFERSPMDTTERLNITSEINEGGLQGMIDEAGSAEKLRDETRPKIGKTIDTIDAAMKTLLNHVGDINDVHGWQNRMDQCRDRIETLDLTLMLIGDGRWNWPRAISALGWLIAFIELSKATLRHNGVDLDAT